MKFRNRERSKSKIQLFLKIVFLFSLSFICSLFANESNTQNCNKCHGLQNFSYFNSDLKSIRNLNVNEEQFKNSVHGKLDCVDCHTSAKQFPHSLTDKKVGCDQNCHANDKEGNPYTHSKVVTEFEDSIHKKGKTQNNPDSPGCISCHGYSSVHNIKKAKDSISNTEKISQCIVCHDNKEMMIRNKVEEDAVESFRQSFHYKAVKFGGVNSATCQDCHGVHKILPKGHKDSSISNDNISNTCGKSGCHEGAKVNFAMSGANHLKLRIDKEPILYFEEKMFQILTTGTLGMLVVGIILDVQKKFGWGILLKRFMVFLLNLLGYGFKILRAVIQLLKVLLFK